LSNEHGDILKVSLEKERANKIELSIEGINITFANAIRRYGMMRTPILAIDNVVFYDNTAWIFDEYLSHRLGMMPITTPEKLPQDVEVIFTLDETGPKIVYSKDIKSNDKEISVAREQIPLLTLNENQRLRFEAKAKLGYGTKHAKFQAGLVTYEAIGENKFKFKVESFYQMKPTEVIVRGCNELEKDLAEAAKELKKAEKKKD